MIGERPEESKEGLLGSPPADGHPPSLFVLRAALQSALARAELPEDRREHGLAALALIEAACAESPGSPSAVRAHLRRAKRHLQMMAATPASLAWDEVCATARRAMTATFFELDNPPG